MTMKNFEIVKPQLTLNEFLGVTKTKFNWGLLLNFVLSVFLVSALSILFKKNINVFQTFMMAVINGVLLFAGIILSIRYLKIENVFIVSLVIGFMCSLTSLLYLDFYYIGMSLLNFFIHFTGHFITFVLLAFFLKKFHFAISIFLTYLSKGLILGIIRFIATGHDAYIAPSILLQIAIYALATAVMIYLGSQLFKLKYYTH